MQEGTLLCVNELTHKYPYQFEIFFKENYMKSKKILSAVLASALCIGTAFACVGMTACKGKDKENGGTTNPPGGTTNPPEGGTPEQDTSVKFTGKIYLVGDSTVCDYSVPPQRMDTRYMNRYGYGTQLYNYLNLNSADQVVNLAISGRSSLSYMTDVSGYYNRIKNEISKGDFLIIGFGHNDEKSDDATRFTDARGTHTEQYYNGKTSFSYNIYENYVKIAESKGATAVVCTPIVRYADKNTGYSGSVVHDTATGNYAQALVTMGNATGTTVVDLTTITKTLYMADNNEAANYHSHSTYKGEKPNETPDAIDVTHINMYGAKVIAYNLLKNLPSGCALKNHVITNAPVPTHAADYASAINSDYVKLAYTPFDPSMATKLTTTTVNETNADWYGTYMGNVSGSNYSVTYAGNKFTVADNGTSGSGKISSTADGFGAAFVQVDITKNFTASAEIKVVKFNKPSKNVEQAAFGMMLRDDIYVNTKSDNLSSNYVAAAVLGDGSAANISRVSTQLTKENKSNSITVAESSVYTVSVTKVGQIITCVFSDGTNNFTTQYNDISFVDVDSQNVYLCLFANRGLTCEFSNVRFEITGESQGA